MDERFDQLSRAMASGMPRRRALKLMAATVGAALLGARSASATEACTPQDQAKCQTFCRETRHCSTGQCVMDPNQGSKPLCSCYDC
jgi:hypothetical protein